MRIISMLMFSVFHIFLMFSVANADELIMFKADSHFSALSERPRWQREKFLQQNVQRLSRQILRTASIQAPAQNLWIANAVLVGDMTTDQRERIQKHPKVLRVVPLTRRGRLTQNMMGTTFTYGLNKIGLPGVQQTYPSANGTGIRVGIIDTGANPQHPSLVNRVVGFKDFTDPTKTQVYDDHGHGSHVAGTVAGAAYNELQIGVAPNAQLLVAKGFDKDGNSKDSALLQALQWMADPDGDPKTADYPRAISNSWNLDDDDISNKDPENEPFCVALKNLRALDIIPVFAAGNDGPDEAPVKVPGACPDSLTVGATDSQDQLAYFSSRGPATWAHMEIAKPEIFAPGVDVESVNFKGGTTTMSGTSMSTPHVAGAIAAIASLDPSLDANAIQTAIIGTGDVVEGEKASRLNVFQALKRLKP